MHQTEKRHTIYLKMQACQQYDTIHKPQSTLEFVRYPEKWTEVVLAVPVRTQSMENENVMFS
jgi:hypothetical protein